jgi:hypothetical protein
MPYGTCVARVTDGPIGVVESGVVILAIVLALFAAVYDDDDGA